MARTWGLVALMCALLAGGAWLYHAGRADQRAADALRNATDTIEGTRDVRDSEDTVPDDDAGLLRWLRGVAAE